MDSILFYPKVKFNIMLPSMHRSSKQSRSFRFSY